MKKHSYPGKFIVFDGLDGSGQSTQAFRIYSYLSQSKQRLKFGHKGVHLTKEPTDGLIGGIIRSQLAHDWKSSPECLQLLFAADREYHLEKTVIPLLKRGVIVICDRYFFSSLAYGSRYIKDMNWLWQLNRKFILPDLTFILKVSPKVCMSRIAKERFEITLYEQEGILREVWKNYASLPKKFKNLFILEGERPINRITQDIIKTLENKLV